MCATLNLETSRRQETYVQWCLIFDASSTTLASPARAHTLFSFALLSPPLSQHFLALVQSSPDLSSPYLYLAQLSNTPQESLSHFENAVRILEVQLKELVDGKETPEGDEDERVVEKELRRQISAALVGMTEIYLTDLW